MVQGSIQNISIRPDQIDSFTDLTNLIRRIHSDRGKEYLAFTGKLKLVDSSYSPTYTPKLNAIAERVNRTIMEGARSIIIKSNVPNFLWPYVVNQISFVRNCVQHSHTKCV